MTAEQIGCAGAMTVLLREALKPNLVQTLEGQPAFVHCGPFANIAHGNSSIVADRVALKLADYVVTESGFGADMGMEKFFDIVCRQGNLRPSAVVLVATVKALKLHGGGRPGLGGGGLEQIERGMANLKRHLQIIGTFGLPAVVAVNRFPDDTDEEVELVRRLALEAGALAAEHNTAVADGGAGAADLARAVIEAANAPSTFAPLYADEEPRREGAGDRAARVRRRRRRVPAGGARDAQALHGARVRQPADLHGQDAPLDLARPDAQGRALAASPCPSATCAPTRAPGS